MPICIECRYPVRLLYTTYSKADDRALGKGVRLTQCPRCKRFADKYVEHDFVVQFIDLVLIKPQVYRHLLFNRLGREDNRFDPSIIRFAILLLLFDVYLTWARIEKSFSSNSHAEGTESREDAESSGLEVLFYQPLVLQYCFFLFLCIMTTLAFHLPIRFLTSVRSPSFLSSMLPYYPHSARVSTALIVSSCTKLFPILLIIWDYDLPSSASAVSWAVLVNNIAALEILTDCGYLKAAVVTVLGSFARMMLGYLILDLVRSRDVGYIGLHTFKRSISSYIVQS